MYGVANAAFIHFSGSKDGKEQILSNSVRFSSEYCTIELKSYTAEFPKLRHHEPHPGKPNAASLRGRMMVVNGSPQSHQCHCENIFFP